MPKWAALALITVLASPGAHPSPQVSAQSRLEAAKVAENTGQYSEAAKDYQEFLNRPPESVDARTLVAVRVRLATDLFMARRYEESFQALAPLLGERIAHRKNTIPARAWIVAGLDELELNRLDGAIRDLRQGLLADPASGTARMALGDALARSGELLQAVDLYRAQAKCTPNVVEAWYKMGMAEIALAKLARRQFEKADPGSPVFLLLQAEDRLDRGDASGAAEILIPLAGEYSVRTARARDKPFPEVHSLLGQALLDGNRGDLAQRQFQEELTENPDSPAAQLGLTEMDALEGRWDAFQSRFLQLMMLNPRYLAARLTEKPPAPLHAAWVSGRMQMPAALMKSSGGRLWLSWIKSNGLGSVQIESRQQKFCSAVSIREALTPGLWLSEGCAEKLRQELEARRLLSPEQAVKLAETEFRLGHFEKAATTAQRVSEAQDASSVTRAWGNYWLIRSYEALALRALEKAVAINPNSARARELLAQNYADHFQWSKAIQEYEAALHLAPEMADLHLGLGTACWETGDWTRAREELRKALLITPSSSVAAYELGDTDLHLGKWNEALPYLRKALTNVELSRRARLDLVKAESELGQYREALADLMPLVDKDPDGEIHFRLGVLYRKMGKLEEARRALAEAQKLHLASDARVTERMSRVEREATRLRPSSLEGTPR